MSPESLDTFHQKSEFPQNGGRVNGLVKATAGKKNGDKGGSTK